MDFIRHTPIIIEQMSLQKASIPEDSPAVNEVSGHFKKTISESIDDWSLRGKKLGSFATGILGTLTLPMAASILLPTLSGFFLGPAGFVGAMALISLEEKSIGIGKRIGGIAGSAIGAGIGVVKALFNKDSGFDDVPGKIELPVKSPKGKGPKEPLFQSFYHKAEKKILGHEPERSKAEERGESLGAFLGSVAGAVFFPGIAVSACLSLGGFQGALLAVLMGTTFGGLHGLVVGSLEENVLGIGRTLGEAAGTLYSSAKRRLLWEDKQEKVNKKVESQVDGIIVEGKDSMESGSEKSAEHLSVIKKLFKLGGSLFVGLNVVVCEPLMNYIIDICKLTSLIMQEEPVLNMKFIDRELPSVNRERLVKNFIKIAGINGVSGKEGLVIKELCWQFDEMKIKYIVDKSGNIIATVPATEGMDDAPTILFSAHTDTVSATSDKAIRNDGRRIRTNERKILGGDDRAGIAQIMEGLRVVQMENVPHPELKIVFTVSEEKGLKGSSSLKPEDISTRPTLGYVLDSTDKRSIYLMNDSVITNSKSIKYNFSQEDPLVQIAMRSMADSGIKPRPIHGPIMAGAATDANTPAFNRGSIKSIALGTGASEIHTTLENIKISALEQVARVVVAIIANSCDLKVNEKGEVVPRYPMTGFSIQDPVTASIEGRRDRRTSV